MQKNESLIFASLTLSALTLFVCFNKHLIISYSKLVYKEACTNMVKVSSAFVIIKTYVYIPEKPWINIKNMLGRINMTSETIHNCLNIFVYKS